MRPMADHEQDHQGPGLEATGSPHRTRLSIPAADVSTIRWLGVQENVSASLRLLVREHIARHGYTDPTCAPVTQQPRRGRPPGARSAQHDQCPDDHEHELDRGENETATIGDVDFDDEPVQPQQLAPLHRQIIAGGEHDHHDHADQGTAPAGEDS